MIEQGFILNERILGSALSQSEGREPSLTEREAAGAAPAKLALLFGTEGEGLSPATIARCDYTVRIPMAHGVDSLNVAASSAVAFYAFRQLSQLGR